VGSLQLSFLLVQISSYVTAPDQSKVVLQVRAICRQGRRQDIPARGTKNHKGGNIFKYNVECMQQPPRKKSLAICKFYSH